MSISRLMIFASRGSVKNAKRNRRKLSKEVADETRAAGGVEVHHLRLVCTTANQKNVFVFLLRSYYASMHELSCAVLLPSYQLDGVQTKVLPAHAIFFL
jgi:hypothetical protein